MPLQRDYVLPYPYPPFIGTENNTEYLYRNIRHLSTLMQELWASEPRRLGVRVPAVATTNAAYTDLHTVSWPAGLLGANDGIHFQSVVLYSGATGTASIRWTVKDGAGTYHELEARQESPGVAATVAVFEGYLINNSSEIAQTQNSWLLVHDKQAGTFSHDTHADTNRGIDMSAVGTATATKTALSFIVQGKRDSAPGLPQSTFLYVEYIPGEV